MEHFEFVVGFLRTWLTITALYGGVGLFFLGILKVKFPEEFVAPLEGEDL